MKAPAAICIFLALAVLIALTSMSLIPRKVQTYGDQIVTAGLLSRPLSRLAVHMSDARYLKFRGKCYHDVRGSAPFYLQVPSPRRILFVTGNDAGTATFHINDIASGQEIKIKTRHSDFGFHIGSDRKAGEDLTDFVESSSTDEIVLATRNGNRRIKTYLNLKAGKVDRVEDILYDEKGSVIEHHNYPGD